jgi:2-amino-4-hydroxy-6-hydroxymethyldihydropteridine diphosphokinase
MWQVILGVGANLGEPKRAFRRALDGLDEHGAVLAVSGIFTTRPIGPDQPLFSNAAALLDWSGTPRELLTACQTLENAAGRNRNGEQRWGPRVLDLDLLIARDIVVRSPDLTLPHPRFHERAFALAPAAELVPDWIHPLLGRTISELAEDISRADSSALISRAPFPCG